MIRRGIIIFERCHGWAFWLLIWNILLGRDVYVVEPYCAYHHSRTPIRFFPRPLPVFVKKMIQFKWVKVVTAWELGCSKHSLKAAAQAVQYCEEFGNAFLFEISCNKLLKNYTDILGKGAVEKSVKMSVCNALAEFLSIRLLLNALKKRAGLEKCIFIPSYNVRHYLFFEKIWLKLKPDFPEPMFQLPRLVLCLDTLSWGIILYMDILRGVIKVFILFVNGMFQRGFACRNVIYGISLVSLHRQMNNQKSLDFLVDGAMIREKDVMYFNYAKCANKKKAYLSQRFPNIFHMQNAGIAKNDFYIYFKKTWAVLRGFSLEEAIIYKNLSLVMENYLIWKHIGKRIKLKNFITHADFGAPQLGRNLALRENGVETWLFMDAANQSYNFSIDDNLNLDMQHPFWCYLDYDRFIVWTPFLAQYFSSHPGSARQFHVTGCLWADYIRSKDTSLKEMPVEFQKSLTGKKVIAVFDSTFSRRGLTSYQEGIAFARHILTLADLSENIIILWKEKIIRKMHYKMDDMSADELVTVYTKIDKHPRIINVTKTLAAGDMIAIADMVISFPFTSTSLEALSAHRKAIWHDPLGLYYNSIYGNRFVTHSCSELCNFIVRLLRGEEVLLKDVDAKVIDPYCDGHATDRFRELLLKGTMVKKQIKL